jgi:hypothetical protein
VGIAVAAGWLFTFNVSQLSFSLIQVKSINFIGPSADKLIGLVNPCVYRKPYPSLSGNRIGMSMENLLWGAPRIHGELLKLGFEVAQSSVAKYMVKRRGPPSQGWRTFLRNRAQ